MRELIQPVVSKLIQHSPVVTAVDHLSARVDPYRRFDQNPGTSLNQIFDFLRKLPSEWYDEIFKRSSPLDDLIFYHLACRRNAVHNVIEIGTFKGLSALFWGTAITGRLYTINVAPQEIKRAKELTKKFGLKNVEFIEGDSLEVLRSLPQSIEGGYNLVYIDGRHDYHYPIHEFRATEPYIDRNSGAIIFDDAGYVHPEGKNDGGVPRAVAEVGAAVRTDFGSRFAVKTYGAFRLD